jgi:hypothetical protein
MVFSVVMLCSLEEAQIFWEEKSGELQTIRRYNPDDHIHHRHPRENFKFNKRHEQICTGQ